MAEKEDNFDRTIRKSCKAIEKYLNGDSSKVEVIHQDIKKHD